ncbi:DNA-binding transcriptional LysR family regulator [Nocardia tenerifensis]|uniref:DNA-binding transcriptional LysR family regulator n=1 Tax=Nocardia tenerifensis TaxID=228006 RepID=A0A318KJ38_9NOCA|nr:LysR family transcriptional regulator [Nocardia tenerifensis]PXX60977.1 DNA-binding transcriptional LysR family regulator [Nocardia tenerifensis]
MDDLRRVRYFLAVAEHRHFGRAAQAVHITQPALSQQVKALEKELGVELLTRVGRGFALTQAGLALQAGAQQLLTAAADLERAVRARAAGTAGELKVAFTRSGSDTDISQRIRLFRKEFPDIEVSTITGWTAWNLDLLESGEVDVAFVRGDIAHPRVRTHLIGLQEAAVVVSKDHALAGKATVEIGDIVDEPIVLWPRHTGPQFYDELLGHIWGDGAPNLVAEEADAEQVLDLVSSGTGISVLDRKRATRIAHENIVVIPFGSNPPRIAIQLAWMRGADAPALTHFLEWWRRGG